MTEVVRNIIGKQLKFRCGCLMLVYLCAHMVEVKGLKLTVVLREEEEGGYSVRCLELPGCISEGKLGKKH